MSDNRMRTPEQIKACMTLLLREAEEIRHTEGPYIRLQAIVRAFRWVLKLDDEITD